MKRFIQKGRYGERLAVFYLESWDFTILECNYKYSYYEIDIIACRENILHFIEVKTRSDTRYGYPEESVSKKKKEHILHAAEHYLHEHPKWKLVNFDIISIITRDGKFEVLFIQDVF